MRKRIEVGTKREVLRSASVQLKQLACIVDVGKQEELIYVCIYRYVCVNVIVL